MEKLFLSPLSLFIGHFLPPVDDREFSCRILVFFVLPFIVIGILLSLIQINAGGVFYWDEGFFFLPPR